jgi:hypothetical protein
MDRLAELGYCGIYCGACKNFRKNMNCMGCRQEQKLVEDCPSRKCTISKNLTHCGECAEFPCKMLKDFYEDGVPLHYEAYKNILRINKNGMEDWLNEQSKKPPCDCTNK